MPARDFRLAEDCPANPVARYFKHAAIDSPSPRGRLEPIGNRRKEFGEAEDPQGRVSGRERVNAGMRASVQTILL